MENNWHGWQTDQTGNSILISPKNQNNKASVTATISGNTLTATSGTFSAAWWTPRGVRWTCRMECDAVISRSRGNLGEAITGTDIESRA